MSLAFGQPYLAIPGPSVLPDAVQQAMSHANPNIYGEDLAVLAAELMTDLRRLAGNADHVAVYMGNGHAAWEAAGANMFSRGDRALALVSGLFGHGWVEQLRAMGVEVDVIDFGRQAAADPQRLAQALAADLDHEIKAVFVTHVDTSTSLRADVAALSQVLRDSGHPALLAVDCVASLGCDEFRMQDWGVDVMVGASQKGLMMPPGLAFVWFSQRAKLRCQASDLRTPWWDWSMRAAPEVFWQYWHGTAPTQHLFALRQALTMILHDQGLDAVWARHAALARAIWAAVEAWGTGSGANSNICLNVGHAGWRAHCVTSIFFGAKDATRLRLWCEQEAGVTLGIGLGLETEQDPNSDAALRIGHMGYVNAHMVLGVLSVIQSGLYALNIPHGRGALEAAAQSIAYSIQSTKALV